jgi:hypothetical protein
VRMHVEAKHFPGTFPYMCTRCGMQLPHRIAFRNHRKQCLGASSM